MAFPPVVQNTITSGINLKQTPVLIDGSDTSDAFKIWGASILKIVVPANFAGSILTFLLNFDNNGLGDYLDYRNVLGNAVFIEATANSVIGVSPVDFLGVKYFKIKSDVVETAMTLQVISQDLK